MLSAAYVVWLANRYMPRNSCYVEGRPYLTAANPRRVARVIVTEWQISIQAPPSPCDDPNPNRSYMLCALLCGQSGSVERAELPTRPDAAIADLAPSLGLSGGSRSGHLPGNLVRPSHSRAASADSFELEESSGLCRRRGAAPITGMSQVGSTHPRSRSRSSFDRTGSRRRNPHQRSSCLICLLGVPSFGDAYISYSAQPKLRPITPVPIPPRGVREGRDQPYTPLRRPT